MGPKCLGQDVERTMVLGEKALPAAALSSLYTQPCANVLGRYKKCCTLLVLEIEVLIV